MKLNLLLASILFSIIFSCKKDDTNVRFVLPAKTQSGQNTFGFLNNLNVWTNYGQVCFPFAGGCHENLQVTFYTSDGDISIHADRVLNNVSSGHTKEYIDLYITTKFRGVHVYSTAAFDSISVGYAFIQQGKEEKLYILSHLNPDFNVTIKKIDTVNKIMSGEFSGKLFRRTNLATFETSTTDSIIVAEGRFDIKMR